MSRSLTPFQHFANDGATTGSDELLRTTLDNRTVVGDGFSWS
jgi:hypothetical protein